MKYLSILSLVVCGFLFPGLSALQARAISSPALCSDKNLMDELDAVTLENIQKQADATINGKGRFWRIEKPGTEPSWLLGTMHDGDPRITALSPAEQQAFDNADLLALELDGILEGSKMAFLGEILAHPEKFMYEEDSFLKNTLPAPQFEMFEQALATRHLSYALLKHTKPWLIWLILASPPCAFKQADAALFFDGQLELWAKEANKKVVALENVHEQLDAIDSLPLNFYITSIIHLVHLTDRLDDYHATMQALYLEEKISTIIPALMGIMARDMEEAGLGDAEMPSAADMLGFEAALLDRRNEVMAARAAPLLEGGNVFIAVGALHLLGKSGLVEQFRRQGYTLSPVR